MKLFPNVSLIIVMLISIIGCNPKSSNKKEQSAAQAEETAVPSYRLEEVWATEATLKTPESVIFDKKRNVLYVANVNENPWEKDENGFISRLSPTGEVLDLEWITGFSGPKGMAIIDNTLYVADLTEVGVIDLEKGVLIDKIQIDGAEGINDLTPDNEGGFFISDSNGGKLYRYQNGAMTVFHGETPGRPNGVFVHGDNLLVAFSKTNEFTSFEISNPVKKTIAMEIGAGDGVTPTNDPNRFLVSDWNGEIFIVDLEGNKQSLLKTKDEGKNTADIWFIAEQNLVLVPTFFDNRIVAYRLVKE